MLQTDQFWQYAKEAIISASRAETEDERRGLLDLAGTWTHAAMIERNEHPTRPSLHKKSHVHKTSGLKEKIEKLKAQMRRLAALKVDMLATPDQQISRQ